MPHNSQQQLESALRSGAEQLGLCLGDTGVAGLLAYLDLLVKWNRAYNLTAVRDPADMIGRHLLDSLAIAPYLGADRYLDVGTGAGLPGIPLALACPQKQFDLLDSNGKKTRFLVEAKGRLNLDNVSVHCDRVERFSPQRPYDGILSRAFASLADMVAACDHLLTADGRLLAMKGQYPVEELSNVPKPYIVESCYPLTVPGVEGERHLLVIGRDRAAGL